MRRVDCLVGLVASVGLAAAPAGASEAASAASATTITRPLPNARIVIHKARRELCLYSGAELVRTYPVGLGFNPLPAKKRQGDGATPEGRYSVCVKNPSSRFHLSLGISYPNRQDAARGLARGLLSRAAHDQISRAHERGLCPPWNTPLGGEIFIHGHGSASDWTLGCVALEDPAMSELFAAVPIGTEVLIEP